MNVFHLLSHQTEMIVYRLQSIVEEKDRYCKVSSPERPNYYWGNFLLFPQAPQENDFHQWMKYYQEEFDIGKQNFVSFTWDEEEEGDVKAFLKNGFKHEVLHALVLKELKKPIILNRVIRIRELSEGQEWEQQIQMHLTEPGYTLDFLQGQARSFQDLIARGVAKRFGAFIGDRLVADLGIIYEGDILRFNNIIVHPKFRRRGICRTLVYEVSRLIVEAERFDKIVMQAEAGEPAETLYLSLGFEKVQRSHFLEKVWSPV